MLVHIVYTLPYFLLASRILGDYPPFCAGPNPQLEEQGARSDTLVTHRWEKGNQLKLLSFWDCVSWEDLFLPQQTYLPFSIYLFPPSALCWLLSPSLAYYCPLAFPFAVNSRSSRSCFLFLSSFCKPSSLIFCIHLLSLYLLFFFHSLDVLLTSLLTRVPDLASLSPPISSHSILTQQQHTMATSPPPTVYPAPTPILSTSPNPRSQPQRLTSIGFAANVEDNNARFPRTNTINYGGKGDRALLRTDTGRISIAASTRSVTGAGVGPRVERSASLGLQRVDARTALPVDFRTLSIHVSETKEGQVDHKGAVKGELRSLSLLSPFKSDKHAWTTVLTLYLLFLTTSFIMQ